MSGDRPGWDQAIQPARTAAIEALHAIPGNRYTYPEGTAWTTAGHVLEAAYPVIVAAVRQHIAAEIDDEANRESDSPVGERAGTGRQIYRTGVIGGMRRAARIALQGES